MKAARLKCLSGLLGIAIATVCGGTAEAATLILGSHDQQIAIGATTMSRNDPIMGEYNDRFVDPNLSHLIDPIGNTLVGFTQLLPGLPTFESRAYLVFNISSLQTPVSSVSLRLLNKRFYSTESTEIIEFYDVDADTIGFDPATSLILVRGDNTFEDLGTGVQYGSAVVVASPPQNDFDNLILEHFEVTLDAALPGLNQAITQGQDYFGIGIRLASNNPSSPYTFDCLDPDTNLPIPGCQLTGQQVEGLLFSGGPRDTEVPDRDVIDLGPLNPDIDLGPLDPDIVAVPEPKPILGLLALGIVGVMAKMKLHRH